MMSRKILRNILKKKHKTNKIAEQWHYFQIKRYGGERLYQYVRRFPQHGASMLRLRRSK